VTTRAALTLALSGASLFVGLISAFVQARNHALADQLAQRQRQWEMLSAFNAQLRVQVSAHVPGVPDDQLDTQAEQRPIRRGAAQ